MATIERSDKTENEQHWIKMIEAVRGSKAAKVWYDYKMLRRAGAERRRAVGANHPATERTADAGT